MLNQFSNGENICDTTRCMYILHTTQNQLMISSMDESNYAAAKQLTWEIVNQYETYN